MTVWQVKLIILVNRNLFAVYGALSKDNDSVIEQEDSLLILSFLHHAAIVALHTDIVKTDSKEATKLQEKNRK